VTGGAFFDFQTKYAPEINSIHGTPTSQET
jgi:hypothetical protein